MLRCVHRVRNVEGLSTKCPISEECGPRCYSEHSTCSTIRVIISLIITIRERCFPQQTRLRILHHQVVIKEPQKLTETKGQGAQLKTQISPYLLWNPWLEQGCGWVVPSLIEVFSTVWWWNIHFNCFNNWASKWNSLSDFQPLCLWAFQATSPCPQFDFPHQRRRKV